jgi:hypothetical protein
MAPPGGFHPMFMLFEHTENCLVVTGTMEFWMTFHSVGNVIIPTDFHSIMFQRGRGKTHQPEKGEHQNIKNKLSQLSDVKVLVEPSLNLARQNQAINPWIWWGLNGILHGDILAGWWFGTFFIFHNIWDIILPIDFQIFQRGWNHQPARGL